ncbi:MAG: hypothetical protein AAF512_19765, partial [Pseudomonadota bacterium]
IIKVGALVQTNSLNNTFWTFKWINAIKMEDYYADYEENYSMQLRSKCWATLGSRIDNQRSMPRLCNIMISAWNGGKGCCCTSIASASSRFSSRLLV